MVQAHLQGRQIFKFGLLTRKNNKKNLKIWLVFNRMVWDCFQPYYSYTNPLATSYTKMNRTIFLLFLTANLTCFSQTQLEMNKVANHEYENAKIELEKTYQKVLMQYDQNRIFIRNLKKSQRKWLKYRNAQLKLRYPKQASEMYGSSFAMCRIILLNKLTKERSETLNRFLTKNIDGDICY
ncbi:DUF1311 domain-containing protein [Rasiella rasia]|uniref:DUF1311 domain-containing protein n=1 Tax=Rasiella rasia TaxID=2744027 RepID=A0A6G6GJ98_9FLAO|nr:lysozyme inhibitor LprI family protein [Rasiella rasia]QIE58629.1 DUF1311 domain-containing protein [Rasiella rasia]